MIARKISNSAKDLIVLVSFLLTGYFFPWWTLILPASLDGYLRFDRRAVGTKTGLIAGLSWILAAAYYDIQTGGRTAKRIAGVTGISSTVAGMIMAYLITGLIAGLTAGFASSFAAQLRFNLRLLKRP